jgi:hypothetical protein
LKAKTAHAALRFWGKVRYNAFPSCKFTPHLFVIMPRPRHRTGRRPTGPSAPVISAQDIFRIRAYNSRGGEQKDLLSQQKLADLLSFSRDALQKAEAHGAHKHLANAIYTAFWFHRLQPPPPQWVPAVKKISRSR